jgi:hypothetical protein
MSESRGIDYKHWIRRKNWPFWQCCWGRTLWPTTTTAEPDDRARGRIGSRSSPIEIDCVFSFLLSFFLFLSSLYGSGETSQRLVTRRLDSFVDFCGRARALVSLTNDSNLLDESFKESFVEYFALWVLKITQNTPFLPYHACISTLPFTAFANKTLPICKV